MAEVLLSRKKKNNKNQPNNKTPRFSNSIIYKSNFRTQNDFFFNYYYFFNQHSILGYLPPLTS